MAFFKFRQSSDAPKSTAPAESVERMRQRAIHRLIGASLLVLLGIFGFPLLFDRQPRPILMDMPIDIPDKDRVLPLAAPKVSSTTVTPPGLAASTSTSVTTTPEALIINETEEIRPSVLRHGDTKEAALSHEQPPTLPPVPTTTAGTPRFIVQMGAFEGDVQVRDLRLKLERAGFKTYIHVADTKDGRRTRVRVGPFADRADAAQAAHKIKALNLPAIVLTL